MRVVLGKDLAVLYSTADAELAQPMKKTLLCEDDISGQSCWDTLLLKKVKAVFNDFELFLVNFIDKG